MAHFSTQIRINATKDQVWEVLSDFGGIYRWNPGVRHSYSTSGTNQGLLATRRCELGSGKDFLDERILEWREGESFKVDIYETNLPLHRNIVEFSIEVDGSGAVVTVAPDYALKFGPLGWLLNTIAVRRQFKKGMEELLAGLKYHIETGETVEDRVPERLAPPAN